ncbi:MAG: siderophore-interacting protein [Bacteroidetes bacterium]|nr:siderophore-interacting protein [Bacteroidota bacterium]
MAQLPKWIADTVEAVANPWLYTVEVTDTQYLTDDIKLVTFSGDFSRAGFQPGQEVQFRVDNHHFRHYTLSAFDKANNTCHIIFYINHKGPGSRWAADLAPGDTARFVAEKGKIRYEESATHHFFFGDETTIGLFDWFRRKALSTDHEYFGVLELHPHNEPALQQLKLMVDSVPPIATQPAANAIHWMQDMDPYCWNTWQKAVFYLAGRVASIQHFRRYLLEHGVKNRQIRTTPYWADSKAGL